MQWLIDLLLERIGLPPDNGRFVNPSDDAIAKYNWLKSTARDAAMGVATATNRRTLILLTGIHTLTDKWTLDTEFVDVVTLSCIASEVEVQRDAAADYVMEQTADDVILQGFTVRNLNSTNASHAFNMNASDNSASIYRHLAFRTTAIKLTNSLTGTSDINGTWEFIEADTKFCHLLTDKDLSGSWLHVNAPIGSGGAGSSDCNGYFEDCFNSVGIFNFSVCTLSGTWLYCDGGANSFNGGELSGTWRYCNAGDYSYGGAAAANDGDICNLSSVFEYCTGGTQSWAYQTNFLGVARYCTGTSRCFAGNGGTQKAGKMNGTCYCCTSTSDSFGGNSDQGWLGGTLIKCRCTGLNGAIRMQSARIEDCFFSTVGSNKAGVLIKDSLCIIYNSTILGTGADFSVKGNGVFNIVVTHCRFNNGIDPQLVNLIAVPYNVDDHDIS